MSIQFTLSVTSTFNTYTGAEHPECSKIRVLPKEAFERGMLSNGMDKTIVEVNSMDRGQKTNI